MDVDSAEREKPSSSKLIRAIVAEKGSVSCSTLTDADLETRDEKTTAADDAAITAVVTSSAETVSQAGFEEKRPSSPTRCVNVLTFTLLASAGLLCQVVFRSTVDCHHVQKAFGLTSLDIGAWFSAYTAAEIVSGVLVTYFAGQGRTPRVLAAALLVSGAACFAHALPHFALNMHGGGDPNSRSYGGASGSELHLSVIDVCGGVQVSAAVGLVETEACRYRPTKTTRYHARLRAR